MRSQFISWCVAAIVAITPMAAWASDITIVIGSEPTTLDPHAADDGGEKAVNDNVFDTLMVRDTEGNLGLGIASAWPTQIDPNTWEFTIEPGITFHNGEPLNAEAVAFSVERMIDPELNSEQLSYFSTLSGAQAIDDLTVQITTSGPDPILPARMYYFMIVPPEASQNEDFAQAPIGSGPYRFVSWDRGNQIVLEADPDFRGGAPDVTGVTYRFIEEPGTRLSTLLAGEVDLVTNLLPEFMGQVPQAASMRSLEHPMVLLNHDGGITADTRVRQALNYAIDKEALASALFEGQAQVEAGQLLGPTYFGYNEDISAYPYDPDRARELLAEAGASDGQITLVSTSGRWLKDRELTEVIGGYWSAIGLDVDVQIYEFDEYLQRLFRSEDGQRSDAIFIVSGNELLDADRSFSAYLAPSGFGASNSIPQMEEWITAARTEIDLDQRQAIYEEVVEYAHEEALLTFLLNINNIWGMSERLSWTPRVDGKLFVSTMSVE